jgi:hypothetical protein
MILIKVDIPRGEIPKLEPELLPSNAAQTAENCLFESGAATPFNGLTTITTPTKSGTKKTIYKFNDSYWFHWITDVDCIRVPIADDTDEVTCWTGDGVPKITDSDIATAGGTDYPEDSYTLGVPAPGSAISAAVVGASVDATLAEDHAYVFTFVCEVGVSTPAELEGPNSAASNIISIEPTQTADLTIPAFPGGDYNFTAKRIYRTQNAGVAASTEYLFVAEVAGDTLFYNDSIANNALGSEIATTTWDPPPSDLHSLKIHPGGFLVGASGMDLCVSVAYQPHAWPTAWRIKLDYPTVGIEIFGTSILVVTTGKSRLFTGTEPDALFEEKTERIQACASKRGIADYGDAVMFPSPDGLEIIGLGVAQNAMAKIFKRSDWQDLDPTTILGAVHDGKYYGFYDDGSTQAGFIFDFATQDLAFIDVYATAVFVDLEEDTLYLQVGNDIVSWNTDAANPLTSIWKSRREIINKPVNPGFAQVRASSYPVTFELYAEISGTMTLKHTEIVADKKPFPLPSGYLSDTFEVKITGGFRSILVAETIQDLKQI